MGHESSLSFTQPFVTFAELGGRKVTVDELVEELRRLPLDGVLGVLAGTSLQLLQAEDFADPRLQGDWLNRAIVDDFPETLPNASKIYAPRRVPFTGDRHVFAHEQNLGWLANAALLHCRLDLETENLGAVLRGRVYRLLLIVNDFLHSSSAHLPTTLEERRQFCLNWLRAGQFNTFFGDLRQTLRALERQRIFYCDLLPQHFSEMETVFCEATDGLTPDSYFQLIALLAAHLSHQMGAGNHWHRRSTFVQSLKRDRDEAGGVIDQWTLTPDEYRTAVEEWTSENPGDGLAGSDLVVLRKTPWIEARPGELVAPIPTFVLSKMHDGPFFMVSDHLRNDQPLQQGFQQAHGYAFQDYARGLLRRISEAGGFRDLLPLNVAGVEVTDHYFQRDEQGFSFELKAGRAPTKFLIGGHGDRVLGPTADLVNRIDIGDPPDIAEGRADDQGIFTRGLWQQTQHGPALTDLAESQLGKRPTDVIPIFIHLAPFRIDAVIWASYLEPMSTTAALLTDPWWAPPLWLQIEDLESLVGLAEVHGEDIGRLLADKSRRVPHERFDIFLFNQFGTRETDRQLDDAARQLLRDAGLHFFDDELDTRG